MILQCAMAHIRREGGLIEILLFFSHEMFIRTFGQIVKLFERTNIFLRNIDTREKLRGGMQNGQCQRAQNFEGRVRSAVRGSNHYGVCRLRCSC